MTEITITASVHSSTEPYHTGADEALHQPVHNMLVFILILFYLIYLFFLLHPVAYRTLVPKPGIEPMPSAVKVLSLNHWTSREVTRLIFRKYTSSPNDTFLKVVFSFYRQSSQTEVDQKVYDQIRSSR